MITITEKDNKIYIIQDSEENKKSSGSGILLVLFFTLVVRLVLLDNPDSVFFILLFYIFFLYTFNLSKFYLEKKNWDYIRFKWKKYNNEKKKHLTLKI